MTRTEFIGSNQAKDFGDETIATQSKKRVDLSFSVDRLKMPTVWKMTAMS